MAIRNFDAIQRKGAMIAEQRQNAFNLKKENFHRRIELIKNCREDAIDAIDTINALYKNGLRGVFEEWMKQSKVRYSNEKFYIHLYIDEQSTEVTYTPKDNNVRFHCWFSGMIDGVDTKTLASSSFNENYFISNRLNEHHYDEALTTLSTALKPFLDGFFAWVATL